MTFPMPLAGASLLALTFATSAAQAVVVDLDPATGLNATTDSIETLAPGFGSEGPVTLNWDPLNAFSSALYRWNSPNYSGRRAAYCQGGASISCALDLVVDSTHTVTLSSFWLGGWPNSDRNVAWSVIDLADTSTVASSGPVTVPGPTGLTLNVNKTSTTGFRILFGPDGYNAGINDITYSFDLVDDDPPSAIPLPATAWMLIAGIGGLAALRRRRG